jgi:Na+/proline symporter
MNAALVVIFGFLILSIYLGIRAQKGKDMNLEQWTVGGRGFGSLLVYSRLSLLGICFGILVASCYLENSKRKKSDVTIRLVCKQVQ